MTTKLTILKRLSRHNLENLEAYLQLRIEKARNNLETITEPHEMYRAQGRVLELKSILIDCRSVLKGDKDVSS